VRYGRVALAAAVLFVAQFVHGLVPTAEELDGGGPVGYYGGLLLLAASLVAAVAAALGFGWSRTLAVATGLAVAIGFVLYHAVPVATPLTNPYFGEPAGVPAWLSVIAAVVAGAWCAYEGRRASSDHRAGRDVLPA